MRLGVRFKVSTHSAAECRLQKASVRPSQSLARHQQKQESICKVIKISVASLFIFISSSVSPIFSGKNSLRIFLNSSDAFFTKLTFPLSSIGAYRAFTTRTQLQRRSSSETSAMLSNKDQECFTWPPRNCTAMKCRRLRVVTTSANGSSGRRRVLSFVSLSSFFTSSSNCGYYAEFGVF